MTEPELNYRALLEQHCSQLRLAEWSVLLFVFLALLAGAAGLVRFHGEGEWTPRVLS